MNVVTLQRTIAGALATAAVIGLVAAAPADARRCTAATPCPVTPTQKVYSYWHYCPGDWKYQVPVPTGYDLNTCHWFKVDYRSTATGSRPVILGEVPASAVPAPKGSPFP